jgi:antitoxin component of MazEF toxin-antitoxin module
MRLVQRLHKNGTSTVVTIPVRILRALNWSPVEVVIVEALEDGSVRVRIPTLADVATYRAPRRPHVGDAAVTP